MKTKFLIKSNGVEDIKLFVRIAQLYDCTILTCDRKADCKSILGMFSIDVRKTIEIEIITDDKKIIKSFNDDIAQFIL